MTTCTPPTTHTHKRGDTFAMLLQLPARFPDGLFADWTVTSQLRTVRGESTVGQNVFVRDGLIEGEAPSLPFVAIEI